MKPSQAIVDGQALCERSMARMLSASRELISTSRRRNERSRCRIHESRRRCLPLLAGGNDRPAVDNKAPHCTHRYVTIEVGHDYEWAVHEATSVASSMADFYISAPYRENGYRWTIAVCRDCSVTDR